MSSREQGPQPLQNGLPEQGPQPLQNGLPGQGPQPLQGDLAKHKQPGLGDDQLMHPKAKLQQVPPKAAGIQNGAKGADSKPYSFGPDSFGPASGQYGMQQARGPQIGVPRGNLGMGSGQGSQFWFDLIFGRIFSKVFAR